MEENAYSPVISRHRGRAQGVALIFAAALLVSGCEAARRLAPGGVLIVEPASGPVENELIAERIEQARAEAAAGGRFPRLADAPASPGGFLSERARARQTRALAAARDGLIAAAASDSQTAEAAFPSLPLPPAGAGADVDDAGDLAAAAARLAADGRADLETARRLFDGAFDDPPDAADVDAAFEAETDVTDDGTDEEDAS